MNQQNRLRRYLGDRTPHRPNNMNIFNDEKGKIANFDTVFRETKAIHERNRDLTTSLRKLEVVEDEGNIKLYEKENDLLLPFSDWSLSQFCNLIGGVHVGYIKKCLERGKVDLALTNLREWMKDTQHSLANRKEKDKHLFLRHDSERLNGILRDRYTVLDDIEVLVFLRDLLPFRKEYVVQSYYVSEELMNVRILQKDRMKVSDEDLFIGINVWNSRVGRSSLNISIMVYKEVCTNGVIVQKDKEEFYIQRHVGIDRDKFVYDFHRMMTRLPKTSKQLEEHISKAIDTKLDYHELEFILTKFKAETQASDKAVEAVKREYQKYGDNRWGLLNRITEVAQEYTLDQKENFEKFAGDFLLKY